MRSSLVAWLLGTAIAVAVAVLIFDVAWQNAAIAMVSGALILRVGLAILRGLATPLPEPPEPGELRKVKITYRCGVCGAQMRMTVAASEHPEPPRHCMEEMDEIETPDI